MHNTPVGTVYKHYRLLGEWPFCLVHNSVVTEGLTAAGNCK